MNLSIIYFTYIPFDVVKYILFGVLTLYKNTNGENKNPSSTKIEHFSTNVNYFNKKLHRRYCRCPNLNTLGMKFQNLKTYFFWLSKLVLSYFYVYTKTNVEMGHFYLEK